MDTTEPNHVYRLRVSRRNGADTEYFESKHSMAWELMRAELEVLSSAPGRMTLREWAARIWHKRWYGEDDDRASIQKVIGVDEFIDGKWQPLQYTVTPPELRIEGLAVPDDRP